MYIDISFKSSLHFGTVLANTAQHAAPEYLTFSEEKSTSKKLPLYARQSHGIRSRSIGSCLKTKKLNEMLVLATNCQSMRQPRSWQRSARRERATRIDTRGINAAAGAIRDAAVKHRDESRARARNARADCETTEEKTNWCSVLGRRGSSAALEGGAHSVQDHLELEMMEERAAGHYTGAC